MAIKGSLKEASLPDVLQLLALGQKTGCLSIADRSNFGYVYFDRGRITYASIVNRRDRLGDILVKHAKISQDQLNEAIDQQTHQRDKRLGEILVAQEVISREDLEHYIRVQIEEAVYFLFTWMQGTFNFESDVVPDREEFRVSINPESLLLEGARRVDEWSLIEKKIPSFDLIFEVERGRIESSDVELTDAQRQIVPLLDGIRDVAGIVEDSGLVEFDVGKALYGLLSAGFAHRTGRSQFSRPAEVNDARMQEHRNLGFAFYKTGMLDEAAREFRRVVELRANDGDAHFYLGLVALKQARWRDATSFLRHSAEQVGGKPAVLHNLALAYEQLGQLDRADSAYGDAAARNRYDPRIMTGWGIAALHRGEFTVAAGRLDRAREIGGDTRMPPIWFWARGLAAAGEEEYEQAESVLREGLEWYPGHVVLSNNLAALLDVLGAVEEAESVLRGTLAEEPSVPQLSKNLGDILYRGGQYDDAAVAYHRAIKLEPELGDDVFFKLGNIAYKRGEREQATAYWKQALELNPGHELVRTNLETLSALT